MSKAKPGAALSKLLEKGNKKPSHRQLLAMDKDHARAAKAANLEYATDKLPGISRIKKGKTYSYQYKGKNVNDKAILGRIKSLAIPPSWSNVWISYHEKGHIQATGIDMSKRKQYRYHSRWNDIRAETKFHRLYEFGKSLPAIRVKLKKDMAQKELSEQKVLAAAINLMEETYIRVGNNEYEKLYGSFGLTTLKDGHVNINSTGARFTFIGKKGVEHQITLKNKKLARIIKQCRDVPGKTLFQFYTQAGERKAIDSGMVNHYIKEAAGQDFSAKDFRTWAGTLNALECISKLPPAETDNQLKKNIVEVLDAVSHKLGNTRTVCKKYYIHPGLFRLYEEKSLDKLLKTKSVGNQANFSAQENLLMSVLKKCQPS